MLFENLCKFILLRYKFYTHKFWILFLEVLNANCKIWLYNTWRFYWRKSFCRSHWFIILVHLTTFLIQSTFFWSTCFIWTVCSSWFKRSGIAFFRRCFIIKFWWFAINTFLFVNGVSLIFSFLIIHFQKTSTLLNFILFL